MDDNILVEDCNILKEIELNESDTSIKKCDINTIVDNDLVIGINMKENKTSLKYEDNFATISINFEDDLPKADLDNSESTSKSIFEDSDVSKPSSNFLKEQLNDNSYSPNKKIININEQDEDEDDLSISSEESSKLSNYSEESIQSRNIRTEDSNNILVLFDSNHNDEISHLEDIKSKPENFGISMAMECNNCFDASEDSSQKIIAIKSDTEDSVMNIIIEDLPQSNNKRCIEENEEFSWDEYLVRTDADAVPPTVFPHVEHSLHNGVEIGQCAEFIHFDPPEMEHSYWIVEVVTVHDSLLRLKFLNIEDKDTPIFWCSLLDKRLAPLGYSKEKIPIVPPTIMSERKSDDLVNLTVKCLETLKSIPAEAMCENTTKMHSRISEGQFVEIMDIGNPFTGWFAKVLTNISGRLKFEFISPYTENTELILWSFYTDARIKPVGWINKSGDKYNYNPPAELTLEDKTINPEWINGILKTFPSTPSCLEDCEPDKHSIALGQRFEYINPNENGILNEVVVVKIHDDRYFNVACSEFVSLTSLNDWSLLPASFCSSHSIPVIHIDNTHSDQNDRLNDLTHQRQKATLEFCIGMKLEVVHPVNPELIAAATIANVTGHLLWLEIDSKPEISPLIRTPKSCDIFPVEWASDNGHSFMAPTFKHKKTKEVADVKIEDCVNNSIHEKLKWCPSLYVNPWCATGHFINKKKLAKIPQSVGPGTLKLVLLRILTLIINSGFRPTRVLNEIDVQLEKKRYWPQIHLKARYKQRIVRATVNIPPYSSLVKPFLAEVCKILECCPNLWTFGSSLDNCPFGCPNKKLYFDNILNSINHKMRSNFNSRQTKILMCCNKQIERSSLADEDEIDGESAESLSEESDCSQPTTPLMEGEMSLYSDGRDELIRKRIATLDPSGLGVWDVESDPVLWSINKLAQYLSNQPDIGHLAPLLKSQDFDGSSFLLLDLPSILHDLNIPYNTGIKLAHCVLRLKLSQLIFDK